MYKINDYLVYKKDVCRLIDIRKNKLTDKEYNELNKGEENGKY